MATDTWTVFHGTITEEPVQGKPLGRHIHHDSRSLAYPWMPRGAAPVSVEHTRMIPILDQGQVGSCTGNAQEGALGSNPLFGTLPPGTKLNEAGALRLYSAAEVIDGNGPYPPNDYGSSGLSVCQAAKDAGLISGYQHCLSVASVLDALQNYPVIIGINWYDSFDSPNADGLIRISSGAQVRGGHELVLRKVDATAMLVGGDNSWGTSWGLGGSFWMGWATLDRLLHESGDATVSVPLSQPAPTPVPIPIPPTPTPDSDAADVALADSLGTWPYDRHVGKNRAAASAVKVWLHDKGFTP